MKRYLSLLIVLMGCQSAMAINTAILPKQLGQAEVFLGQTAPGTTVTINGTAVPVTKQGLFLGAVGRDFDKNLTVKIGETVQYIPVKAKEWDIQRISGLARKFVEPDPEVVKRIQGDNAAIGRVRRTVTPTPHFLEGFVKPATGRTSGVFGSQRILNGKPRSPHRGVDYANKIGTPILAAGTGTIALIRDMHYTGNTVMIDHGHGLTTVYAHLDSVNVHMGETVQKGQPIGTMGMTGRATGPHLHWGATLGRVHVDPEYLLALPLPSKKVAQ